MRDRRNHTPNVVGVQDKSPSCCASAISFTKARQRAGAGLPALRAGRGAAARSKPLAATARPRVDDQQRAGIVQRLAAESSETGGVAATGEDSICRSVGGAATAPSAAAGHGMSGISARATTATAAVVGPPR
jgi:hypothetical protein